MSLSVLFNTLSHNDGCINAANLRQQIMIFPGKRGVTGHFIKTGTMFGTTKCHSMCFGNCMHPIENQYNYALTLIEFYIFCKLIIGLIFSLFIFQLVRTS